MLTRLRFALWALKAVWRWDVPVPGWIPPGAHNREKTALEVFQQEALAELNSALLTLKAEHRDELARLKADADREAAMNQARTLELETRVRLLEAEVLVASRECQLLADVHERDRMRVEKESKILAQEIAVTSLPVVKK